MVHTTLGVLGETAAVSYIAHKGYQIIERNYRIKGGELDIIAIDGIKNELVFIEVKTRSSLHYGYPEEQIGAQKMRRLLKTIKHYLASAKVSQRSYRLDSVSIMYDKTTQSIADIYHSTGIDLPDF